MQYERLGLIVGFGLIEGQSYRMGSVFNGSDSPMFTEFRPSILS
jgi:hypothetical protein